jgi:hypothetical protein
MPTTAPCQLALRQNVAATSTGNREEAAMENAAPTRNKILPGRVAANHAAAMDFCDLPNGFL